jgi:UDP-glucuronate 4-epimerase
MQNILVTGCAGFIGFHVAKRLIEEGRQVVGLDNLNDYYDPALKEARLSQLASHSNFRFLKMDLADRDGIAKLFRSQHFDKVVNLAAQPGVRYSLQNPHAYVDANLVGFVNILEGCRHGAVGHLVFASSSSVYGANSRMPFSVRDNVDHPISLYGATKKANELMAHVYAHLYGLPCTGLRLFTVYGPWGRPDMAPVLFARAIVEDKPIDVFNYGRMLRDFTYIADVVEAVARLLDKTPKPDPKWSGDAPECGTSSAPFRIYNIGNSNPVEILTFIRILESKLGKKARINALPLQPGEVPATYADIEDLAREVGFRPRTSLEEGIEQFVAWYREYYRV